MPAPATERVPRVRVCPTLPVSAPITRKLRCWTCLTGAATEVRSTQDREQHHEELHTRPRAPSNVVVAAGNSRCCSGHQERPRDAAVTANSGFRVTRSADAVLTNPRF